LRKQFLIPADEVYLNNGTVGSSPAPVLRAIFDGYNDTERMAQSDPEDYPIWGYGPGMSSAIHWRHSSMHAGRGSAAAECDGGEQLHREWDRPEEGDEVLITDQEHPAGSTLGICERSVTELW